MAGENGVQTAEGSARAAVCPRNEVAVGDCIELMKSWPAGSVDMIFADPPYNIGYEYDEHYIDRRSDEEYIDWSRAWVGECARLLKPTGSFYILIGDEYAAEIRLMLKELEKQRMLTFRNWIIWHYTFGQNCKFKFNRSHAHLFYCVGSAAVGMTRLDKGDGNLPFCFNREAIAVPSARLTTYGDTRANPKGKMPDDTWYLRPQATLDEIGRYYLSAEMDTWYQSRLCGTFKERVGWHPCQLPEALLERIVLLSSNPGDLVFDPFLGSGTTAAVARQFGRDWLGCELGEEYAQKARERIMSVEIAADPSPSMLKRWMEAKGSGNGEPGGNSGAGSDNRLPANHSQPQPKRRRASKSTQKQAEQAGGDSTPGLGLFDE